MTADQGPYVPRPHPGYGLLDEVLRGLANTRYRWPEVAKLAGLDKQQVGRIARRTNNPPFPRVVALHQALTKLHIYMGPPEA